MAQQEVVGYTEKISKKVSLGGRMPRASVPDPMGERILLPQM